MISINKKTFFWLFQTSYWLLVFVFESEFVYGSFPLDHYLVVIYCFLFAIFGIPLSLLFVRLYKIKFVKNLPKTRLLFLFIFTALIGAHIWLIEIEILDSLFYAFLNVPTGIAYIRDVLVGTIILSIWSILFLLFDSWYELLAQKEDIEKAVLLVHNAQLNVLRYQLNPHFLFNSLNSIRALIYKSPPDADKMISQLSDLMRYSLSTKNQNEIPLEEEIEVIKSYLNIEKIRFGNKLIIEIKVDAIANEYPIPPFLIIPLVENAIKYGMKTSKLPLEVKITAEVNENILIIMVRNTGRWFEAEENDIQEKLGTGTGLTNVKDRLENIYPNNHKFYINKTDENVSVYIHINKEITYDEK